ncbi:GMC family oxidoreductase [Novosphingobium taihuense]|uniref:Choline dehydrogenase-like flavoprotein n=1 Tax=Novosphingobium taihuense TaxID=260085 RepID=A0A7W7AF05_9SPHN|nr:GMC family oxidoreductase N-terminal domain-containing protein [Novosphingobium taihuense]MBB4615045.1 choline dehydrogenase-like flavoprotein [Novosphingobium taihuense]TWH79278.1 choline dehydrogenase-like flavoprotein [Novosphingobium taihuense]
MTEWDYIIVGAGSAGCVLAERLSANPANSVLLLEAGPVDKNPFIHMPRGVAKLYSDPAHVWYFQTEAHDDIPSETWLRGKMLGGSSSINGMMYFRGQPEDYDGWEALGAKGWGWDQIGAAFRAMEKHELGADGVRGDSGPLGISVERERTPLTEAFIKAGEQMGVPRVDDLNRPKQGGVGYATRTIRNGRRQSTAQTFLKSAQKRPNLTVKTGVAIDRVLFEGKRAAGVVTSPAPGRAAETIHAAGEVIISAGALMSPQILQRSGVGSAEHLAGLGIPVVVDSPGVGEHMLEHRLFGMHYGVTVPFSHNRQLRGLRVIGNALRWFLTRTGPMAVAYGTVGAFAKVLPESTTPDIEILFSPVVATPDASGQLVVDTAHSVTLFGYPLRSRSEGSIHITSADPNAPGRIRAGYLSDPYDCAVTIAMHRFIRKWMEQPAIAAMVSEEREPSRSLQTDEEIIHAYRTAGQAGYHACGTCRMGAFDDAVLDEKLRVRGVSGLRVVDGSIMPTMVSANTNGPIMASAWRAAELILEGRNR